MPITPIIMPMTAEIRPLIILLEQMLTTTIRPMMPRAKYSHEPKSRATFASCGATMTMIMPLNTPPITEANTPRPSASAGRPFRAIGAPSKQVTSEAGEPGMFSRQAEIRPPEIPPT